MQVRARQSGFVRTEGGLLPADLLERVRALDPKVLGSNAEASYGLDRGDRFGEATTRAWNRLVGAWTALQVGLAQLPETDPATTTTRERFLLPLMEELGYGRLTPTKAIELDGKSYPISHGWGDAVPLHLVGANVPLDRRTQRVAGAAGQSPHGLLQELLNRSPERLWGIVSNARTLRILRDNASLTRQAYVEFDLEAIFEGESYADFALLWHLAHRTRLEPRLADGAEERSSPSVHGCYLEHWSKIAEETGARARDRLRDGVGEAIEALGSGFLRHPANTELKAALQSGDLATQDYYRELLRLVYRFILLFVAEDRDLLLDPTADPATRDRYARYYSTARLRHLAERRKGSRHADLYAGLRVVVEALGRDEGAPGIGLPPLGGFLFGPEACPHLDAAQLANADLLDAIRKLATIEEKGVLRSVDYRNLASEELGSIYESLLERHPEIDTPTGSFALKVAAGHERKTTGSYYTPSSLISVLLDSALDPVLEEKVAGATTKEDQEQAILDMSVVDPAAGSGHFLVAAAHRIAKRLAQVRTGDEEPAPDAVRTALRDVIGHCLYAVDINPMAVELCKVSLWLEALEPGKPLTFLDAHIKCGNSLLGTTPELIAQGIPDAAYDPIEGDDPVVAKALKKRNKAEREGQLSLGEAGLELPIAALAEAMREVDALPDDSVNGLAKKSRQFALVADGSSMRNTRLLADIWFSAFLAPARPGGYVPTSGDIRSLAEGRVGQDHPVDVAVGLASSYGVFHWQIEFPTIAIKGGFHLVIGNPPWDRVKLEEQEFFTVSRPDIAAERNRATRKRMIVALEADDPPLWRRYKAALRHAEATAKALKGAGRHPLSARGDLNTYPAFVETMTREMGPRGRTGVIVPTGIATDELTTDLFGSLMTHQQVAAIFDFENRAGFFPTVDSRQRFCLLTLTGRACPSDSIEMLFFGREISDLGDPVRRLSLTPDEIRLMSPSTGNVPTFRSRIDADIALGVYRRWPTLMEPGSGWSIRMARLFDVAKTSDLLIQAASNDYLPVWEAKLFHQFNHRWATYDHGQLRPFAIDELQNPTIEPTPRKWASSVTTRQMLGDARDHRWFLAWRDVARATDERTMIASAITPAAADYTVRLALSSNTLKGLLLANLNSLVFDWVARQKVGGAHLSDYITGQLPVVPPNAYLNAVSFADKTIGDLIRRYAVELVYTTSALEPFATELGWLGPPFEWKAERRRMLRAELDALYFHLYGVSESGVARVVGSFSVLRHNDEDKYGYFITLDAVHRAFQKISGASHSELFVSELDPPPGENASSGRGWIPWERLIDAIGHS